MGVHTTAILKLVCKRRPCHRIVCYTLQLTWEQEGRYVKEDSLRSVKSFPGANSTDRKERLYSYSVSDLDVGSTTLMEQELVGMRPLGSLVAS